MNSSQQIIQSQTDFLEIAGNMLDLHDSKDQLAPGLLELTGVGQHVMITASGLNDYDYQNLSCISLGQKQLHQLQTVNKIPIPTEILDHFKHIKCQCMMGLFPEIGRAWLSIDSEIYIWTYEQARDVAYYDGLSHPIVSVGLVKPKIGVFINDVKYLLVLTTYIEIIILGVTFGDTTKTISSPIRNMQGTATFEEMQLMNKPIFVLSTENISMNVIQGSNDGRIFLGGRDGCLYEISYQAEFSWFGKRCKKTNHSQSFVTYVMPNFLKSFREMDSITKIVIDDSRKLLYTLTEKSAIEVWDMSDNANSMKCISRITQNTIAVSASNAIKTIDPSIFRSIKTICPISNKESANLNLIAVTQCGTRLFFSTTLMNSTNKSVQMQSQIANPYSPGASFSNLTSPIPQILPHEEGHKPQGLFLLHVRLPPGYTPNSTINKPKQVHSAYYSEGTMLLISNPQQDQDVVWSISSSPFPHRSYLTESTEILNLDGVVWSMAELRDRCAANMQSILRIAQKPKKVVLLTNQGAHIVAILKPADILQQLLLSCHGPHHEAVKSFFHTQTDVEACATCLLLACSEQYRGTDLAMWAAQAFMLYGGEPLFQQQINNFQQGVRQQLNNNMTIGPDTNANVDRNLHQMYMSTPIANSNLPPINQNLIGPTIGNQSQYTFSPITAQTTSYRAGIGQENINIKYSAKHDGLYLYVARLLRPIWKMRVVDINLSSSLTQLDCSIILEDLYSLKSFLDANSINDLSCTIRPHDNQSTFSSGYNLQSTVKHAGMPDNRNATELAQIEEKRNLTALNYFIKHACEVIGLWKILCEHQFQVLAKHLVQEQQEILGSCTFNDLILSRTDSCALLIVSLINSYLRDNASVSLISAKLREVCPNLYRHEDAISFKATEILMNSKTCNVPAKRKEQLRIALQLCQDAAPNLPIQNICQQFTLANFYEGVIELTATCASKIDPEEIGIHFYNNDEPGEDREGFTAYAARMACYKEIKLMLDYVYQTICNNNINQEFSTRVLNPNNMEDNSKTIILNIVRMAIEIKDPLLHVCVYEWLMLHDMLSELLGLSEPTLGEYLRRGVIRNPENFTLIDLLWKYYEKNEYHAKAAQILDNLATTNSEILSLEQRIEFLARAVMCMRNDNIGYSLSNGILLKELEDKLEIARVQKSVLDELTPIATTNHSAVKALKDLNFALYDITELYQNFAEPFNLWDCKLIILNCSQHNDPLLIESVWTQIINQAIGNVGTINDKCVRLFTKVESLVKEFSESGHCFPLAFLIHELEVKACQYKFPEGIVPDKLVNMNIDIDLLLEYYFRMISMNERIWANEGNEWHLVQSSIKVISLLLNNTTSNQYRTKRRIFGKAQDIVSVCLNYCYQKPGTDRLQHALKDLQCQLQRSLS